jgi:hypothetical protein
MSELRLSKKEAYNIMDLIKLSRFKLGVLKISILKTINKQNY